MTYNQIIEKLKSEGNYRFTTPPSASNRSDIIDLTTNDYMGFATDESLVREFFSNPVNLKHAFSSSASRLLAANRSTYDSLENKLGNLYGKSALLFNSGYHANTGLISALCDNSTVILADKLVHASIIDGIKLSGAPFERWRHNDTAHLEKLLTKHSSAERILIVAESVYSMDGDRADIEALIKLKERYPQAMLYIDEAHAVGCVGPQGLGLVAACSAPEKVDVVVGTFGKALASQGAFAVMSELLRDIAVNKARSFIFSTAIPPISVAWSEFVLDHSLSADSKREHLQRIGSRLCSGLGLEMDGSHIVPYIIGDAKKTLLLSQQLLEEGIKILPIRTPTVPPGTERLRISLNADLTDSQIDTVIDVLNTIIKR